jgi:hypothetical protein
MSENNHIFTCRQCGGHKLAYHEYVKSITPADSISDEKIYYAPMIIDENDFIPELSGFCCRDCGHMLEYCGRRVNTEIGLMSYLSLDPDLRSKEQSEYEEQLIAQMDAQDEQEYS